MFFSWMVAVFRCCGSRQKYILPNLSELTIRDPSCEI